MGGILFRYSVAVAAVVYLLCVSVAWGAWPSEPASRLEICTQTGAQGDLRMAPVEDGYILAWTDQRRGSSYTDIYVQKVDRGGNILWQDQGRIAALAATASLVNNHQARPFLAPSTGGSAILLWTDSNPSWGNNDNVWATRLHADGVVSWGNPGLPLQGTDTGVLVAGQDGTMPQGWGATPDSEGGAFAGFSLGLWSNIFVHRYDLQGNLRAQSQDLGQRGHTMRLMSSVSPEGKDLLFVARLGGAGFGPLMLRKLLDPEIQYPGGGVDELQDFWGGELQVSPGVTVDENYSMLADGSGGLWIVWSDRRNGNSDIFLQHISYDGTELLGQYGITLCNAPGDQRRPQMVSDGEGGVIVVWQDERTSPQQVYGQRVDTNGQILWDTNGLLISSARGTEPQILRTSDNYFIVVWRDDDGIGGSGMDYLRAQRLTPTGYAMWDPDGVKVSEDPWAPSPFVAAPDQSGGAVVFYVDDGNIYGNRVIFDGTMSSFIRIYGPHVVGTGNMADYILRVGNMEGDAVHDAVVVMDLPPHAEFVWASQEGAYWPGRHQVVWKLGEIPVGERLLLPAQVRYRWGIPPHTPYEFWAAWGGTNISENPFEVQDYLEWEPTVPQSSRALGPGEIDSFLQSHDQAAALLQWLQAQGYGFYQVTRSVVVDAEKTLTFLFLVHPTDPSPVLINVLDLNGSENAAFVERISPEILEIFDQAGGLSYSSSSTFRSWGRWSVMSSPSKAHCTVNCMIEKLPEMVITNLFPVVGQLITANNYVENWYQCKHNNDWNACYSLGEDTAKQLFSKLGEALPENIKNIPAIDIGMALGECIYDCQNNPSSHVCTEDAVACSKPTWWEQELMGRTAVLKRRRCNPGLGIYEWGPPEHVDCRVIIPCGFGQVSTCVDNQCGCMDCDRPQSGCFSGEVRTAHDPNAKFGVEGQVVPGQLLEYLITYENTGQDTAYGVYVLDELDQWLDLDTVEVLDSGILIKGVPAIIWGIGDLPAGGQGAVRFRARVKGDTPAGTVMVNMAQVYFPSVPEITPTNPVVNVVAEVVAFPQQVETSENTPVDITLEGAGGQGGLEFAIDTGPMNGTLSGQPPQVTYTPAPDFDGEDSFTFTVTSAARTSPSAMVRIRVEPSQSDNQAPSVERVVPEDGARVQVSTEPFSQDPILYLPLIKACFEERLDPTTVLPATFTLSSGQSFLPCILYYDDATMCVSMFPQEPLAYDTAYTVTVQPGVADMSANAMTQAYSWTFRTWAHTSARLEPLAVDCGAVEIGTAASAKRFWIVNQGVDALALGEIEITGENPQDFVLDTQCSNSLIAGMSQCPVDVRFVPQSQGAKRASLEVPGGVSNPDLHLTGQIQGTGTSSEPQAHTLGVQVTGQGMGTVTSSPEGVACPGDCAEVYLVGTQVRLSANPSAGSVFAGWEGDPDCLDGIVTMNSDKACTASFELLSSGPDLSGNWIWLEQVCRVDRSPIKCRLKGLLTVQNQGAMSTGHRTQVAFYLSSDEVLDGQDRFLKEKGVGKIKPGAQKTKRFMATLPEGETASGKYVIAVLDSLGTIQEVSEVNNQVSSPLIP
ncbi:MAG: Ig-like domain-containing protein [bacterium]